MRFRFLIILLITIPVFSLTAESIIGIPFISHFSESDYKASNNNWDMVQDQRGIMYFANEFGILEFDGHKWKIIQIASNRSNIKSLAFDKKERLYAGAQDDFGYLDASPEKGLHFVSLMEKIPEASRNFGDVHKVLMHNDRVIFHTWGALFIYENDSIKILKTGNTIKGINLIGDQVIAYDYTSFYYLTDQGLQKQAQPHILIDKSIRFVLPFDKTTLLVGTHLDGLFLVSGNDARPLNADTQFKLKGKMVNAHLRKNGDFVISTSDNGIFILDKTGKITNHLSKNSGLQNNEIRNSYTDRNNNLWVANKRGIDFLELSSPFSQIFPSKEDPIGVYAACMHHNNLYLATHNGILKSKLNSNPKHNSLTNVKFKRVESLPHLNWNLNKIQDILVVAHGKGFNQIIEDNTYPLYEGDGGWLIVAWPQNPNYFIAGTYLGLVLFEKVDGKLKFKNKIAGFEESSRVIEIDKDGNIWIAHGYKGIYRLRLNDSLNKVKSSTFYNIKKGLPSNYYNSVFKVWDEIVFGTQNGFYSYNAQNDTMIVNQELSNMLGNAHGKLLRENAAGNLWFISGDETGIVSKHADGTISVEKNTFSKLNAYYIPGFEHFYFMDANSTLIGAKDGMVAFNHNKKSSGQNPSNMLLRQVKILQNNRLLYEDRIHFLSDSTWEQQQVLPYSENSFQFSFASAGYDNLKDIKYKFFLDGYDDNWSEWNTAHYKDYTNLPEGDYTFRVKSKNVYQSISEEETFSFTILPPWYRTKLAFGIYLLSIIAIMYALLNRRNQKIKKEKERYIQEQTRLRELERSHFNKEKLENELQAKNTELASAANKIIYKNEKLLKIKEEILHIVSFSSSRVENKMRDLLEVIEVELGNDDWKEFELRFDQAHNNFINDLKTAYPELTPKDLKICAYLKMNLNTKEIAQLLNMTVRGVENSRYRIRKRIGLDSSVNLSEWLFLRN